MASISSAVAFDDSCVSTPHPQKRREDIEHEEFEWIAMKKRITGLVKRVSISNIRFIADEILKENVISGRGLFCQAIMKSQMGFPQFSNVYAALVAIINSRFPDVGLLLVKRVVAQFKEAYEWGNKKLKRDTLKFLAHLANQTVVYEVLAVDILMLLLGNPSLDNIEVAVNFCIECGSLLQNSVPHIWKEVLGEFRRRKREVEMHVKGLIVKLFAVGRSKFKKYPSVIDELDLVEVEDQVTHVVSLLHDTDPEYSVDNFEVNTEFDDMSSQIMVPCEESEDDEASS
ncbi:hypothetical protein CDL12_25627 [Handroanthus impetiginosus]|uniref:MIF4G domain-containing protein n=1 Tax=Handroanthus impetiginosus TaxID=429701 RepID=A0A2G9G9G3_9LAMI|nr:hypothetical protein CDL12_25627 [Handroanthus impetiginosus]